ncbi:hypothetical protein V8G54_025142 [Vigna mungo]|uniref:Uncharacterized protein n=1 Tax=Vigna mungo TaxID=3915 RepID=A0AAQ3RU30_VIGMU
MELKKVIEGVGNLLRIEDEKDDVRKLWLPFVDLVLLGPAARRMRENEQLQGNRLVFKPNLASTARPPIASQVLSQIWPQAYGHPASTIKPSGLTTSGHSASIARPPMASQVLSQIWPQPSGHPASTARPPMASQVLSQIWPQPSDLNCSTPMTSQVLSQIWPQASSHLASTARPPMTSQHLAIRPQLLGLPWSHRYSAKFGLNHPASTARHPMASQVLSHIWPQTSGHPASTAWPLRYLAKFGLKHPAIRPQWPPMASQSRSSNLTNGIPTDLVEGRRLWIFTNKILVGLTEGRRLWIFIKGIPTGLIEGRQVSKTVDLRQKNSADLTEGRQVWIFTKGILAGLTEGRRLSMIVDLHQRNPSRPHRRSVTVDLHQKNPDRSHRRSATVYLHQKNPDQPHQRSATVDLHEWNPGRPHLRSVTVDLHQRNPSWLHRSRPHRRSATVDLHHRNPDRPHRRGISTGLIKVLIAYPAQPTKARPGGQKQKPTGKPVPIRKNNIMLGLGGLVYVRPSRMVVRSSRMAALPCSPLGLFSHGFPPRLRHAFDRYPSARPGEGGGRPNNFKVTVRFLRGKSHSLFWLKNCRISFACPLPPNWPSRVTAQVVVDSTAHRWAHGRPWRRNPFCSSRARRETIPGTHTSYHWRDQTLPVASQDVTITVGAVPAKKLVFEGSREPTLYCCS